MTVRRKTVETPWQQRNASSRVVASVIGPGGGLLAVTFMHAVMSASVCLALGHTLLGLAGRAPAPPPPRRPLPADATCWPAHGL
eukprot:COSAG01_NODE_777_length_13689_cov_18.035467_2_plen_84_part_00